MTDHRALVGRMTMADHALRIALHARAGVADGRYCECATPDLIGLVCQACQLRHRGQEIRAVHRIVDAHRFSPGKLSGRLCAVCVHREDDPRHHGVPAVGRTSWGEMVQGVAAP